MKKCVIIGSGLGGLSCACILAKNGYEVTVLEQGEKIGGCLQCFKRGDALFDTGMHYIGSAESGQTLHTMLRYLGLDSKNLLSRLDPKGYDIVSINGEQYPLANGREPLSTPWQNVSPAAERSCSAITTSSRRWQKPLRCIR